VGTTKSWAWVLVAVLGCGLVALLAIAGAGVYFVSRHIDVEQATDADALRTLDLARSRFGEQRPLYQVDGSQRPQPTGMLGRLPQSTVRPDHLMILAWDPANERLVRVSLPFWLLKVGRHKFELRSEAEGFDLSELDLDINELERVGPVLVFERRDASGQRILAWTE
jgi:hypothetical protein